MEYLAHSYDEELDCGKQTYHDHITNVYKIAMDLVERKIKPWHKIYHLLKEVVSIAALYHDLGKLDEYNQKILNADNTTNFAIDDSDSKMINHVDAGVAYCLYLFEKTKQQKYLIAAIVIKSHHIGLDDFDNLIYNKISGFNVNNYIPKDNFRDYRFFDSISCRINTHVDKNLENYLKIHSSIIDIKHSEKEVDCTIAFVNPLIIKIALSILINADHDDTANNYGQLFIPRTVPLLRPQKLLDKIERYIKSLPAIGRRNGLRNKLRQYALEYDKLNSFIDVLDGIVGLGKTISGITLALRNALYYGCNRINVILPYIALIEQSSEQYKKIFGKSIVSEIHHLTEIFDFRYAKYVKGFSSPVNITTNANFFEILSSNKVSKIKNLYHVLDSIWFIDEYHTLSSSFYNWEAIMEIFRDVWDVTNTKVILSSGTPSKPWDLYGNKLYTPSYVGENNFFVKMMEAEKERVEFNYIENQLSMEELCDRIEDMDGNGFVVFDTKEKAKKFYMICKDKSKKNVYLRYTRITPKDRKNNLERIKVILKEKKQNIILIATTGSDVGLDLSFDFAFGELISVDSLIQLSGRVNRNLELEKPGKVYYFSLNQLYKDNKGFKLARKILVEFIMQKKEITPELCQEAIEELWNNNSDIRNQSSSLKNMYLSKQYRKFAENFTIIEDRNGMISILVDNEIKDKICKRNFVRSSEIENNSVVMFANIKDIDNWKTCGILVPIVDKNEKELYFWNGIYSSECGIDTENLTLNANQLIV